MRRAGSGVALVAMVVASGGAGLTWELLWQQHASLAIGVSALGAAIVLSCTMAGMAAGALAAGAWLKGRAGPLPPLRLFALLEAVVGLAGLGLGPGFAALARIDRVVWAHAPSLAPLAQAAGIALLVGPAAAAMGATVPVFRRLAARSG